MTFKEEYAIQMKLLYSVMVAGKSASFVDKCLECFIKEAFSLADLDYQSCLPFEMLDRLTAFGIEKAAKRARTGNYTKLVCCIHELKEAIKKGSLDLMACTPEDLEAFHGIGPKTSRFFIMWTRPDERYAALDVHVLRWMRGLGYDAPAATPQSTKRYRALELAFLEEAKKRGKTPRQLDSEIWEAGAGRTQNTTEGH